MIVGSKLSLLLFSLAFAVCTPVHAQNTASLALKSADQTQAPLFKREWSLSVGGISMEHGKDSEAAAFFYGGVNFDYHFTSWLRTHLSPRASVFSTRVQERYSDSGEESRLWMYDGYLAVDPAESIEFRGGSLNQKYHGTGLLISGLRSFPGAQEILKFKSENFKAALIFQQSVPTSHSLNDERMSQEKLPTFMTQTVQLSGKNFGLVEWKASGGLYDWNNIPDKVVSDSRRIGNVGVGENVAGSKFLYDHQGWYFASELCLCSGSGLGGVIEFERVHNLKAPGDSADAQLIGFGPKFEIGNVEMDLRYRPYFIESDATVAAYNKSKFGNTNRNGYNIEANVTFKKEGFTIFAENYNAKPINRDPNQRDLSIFYLGVETNYAPF
jgi:hypothetical protein